MAETNGSSTNGILKLQTNVPEVIALRFAEGKPATSQFGGNQLMYSLVDGRKAFPPLIGSSSREVAALISHLRDAHGVARRASLESRKPRPGRVRHETAGVPAASAKIMTTGMEWNLALDRPASIFVLAGLACFRARV